jgi:phosphotriesterase-related protein
MKPTMWNPDIYRDTDYGLEDDETFEPQIELEEEYVPGPGDPFIMTVLGPIHPDDAGVTLVREHLQWAPARASGNADPPLADRGAALLDLEAFFTVAGRTVVSATPPDAGRDARALLWLAQHAPVHIVAATGFSGDALAGNTTADQVRETIERDLEQGMDGTAARPGILVAGAGGTTDRDRERAAIASVGTAHERHGLPVMALGPASGQVELIERLRSARVPAGRLIVAGAGDLPEPKIDALARHGAWLLFDGLGGGDAGDDWAQARRIARLAADGHVDRLLLSHAFRSRLRLTGYEGRPGLGYIIEQFAVILLEEGLEALDVRRMLVDNAVTALTIVAAGSGAQRTHREKLG